MYVIVMSNTRRFFARVKHQLSTSVVVRHTTLATGKMWNTEGKMRNEKCGTTVFGPQVRPPDRSYYAVYRRPRVAGTAVNCVMRICAEKVP